MSSQDFSRIGTVIIFGISGVGKTTACAAFGERHPEVLRVSAGSLLQSATAMAGESLRTDSSHAILKFQALLGDAYCEWRSQHKGSAVLIEAHSVIDNDHEIIEVPVEVIRSLRPTGLILLEASPEIIAERRELDLRRRPVRSNEELAKQAAVAKKMCLTYARDLGLPLEVGSLVEGDCLEGLVCKVASRMPR